MTQSWGALTKLIGGAAIEIERVRVPESGIAIEGRFELPPLAQLPGDDQVFIAAFVRSHGSIKQMEKLFGVSYPTIKNRLNRIAGGLPLPEVTAVEEETSASHILDRLERGEMTANEAIARLKGDIHE